jgi:HupE / UreJ protein
VRPDKQLARVCVVLGAVSSFAVAMMGPVSAHKSSDSYLNLRLSGAEIVGQWDVALRDLDYAVGLDADNDGIITWRELRSRHVLVADTLLSHLSLQTDGKVCPTRIIDHLVDEHSDGAYEVLRFTAECGAPVQRLDIGYDFFFDLDPQHRGLLRLQTDGGTFTTVFSPSQKGYHLEGNSPSWAQEFVDYFKEGVWHIWTGFDHILFLCALLLPSVLSFHSGKWWALRSFREAFRNVFKIITAFTLAHSITLSLAVLGFIADALAIALVGFNLGVEAGQLVIVCAVLPLAYCCRRSWLYPRLVLGAGSAAIVAIAFIWLIERSFNLNIFS